MLPSTYLSRTRTFIHPGPRSALRRCLSRSEEQSKERKDLDPKLYDL